MKSLILSLMAAATLASALPAAAQPVDARATHQEQRIETGVRAGRLGPHQAVRLQHREHRLKRIEVRMRERHDGRLTHHDRRILTRMENRDSHAIRRARS